MFERTIGLIGENNFKKIQKASILIVGVGGVGGICLEALVRSGIKNIICIDNDVFSLSNLNRQIICTNKNINKDKITEALIRMKNINNDINIVPLNIFLDKNNIDILDNYKIDYIIDACDTIETKIELVKYALKHNIKIISSMGTGKKIDPTKLCITTISKTFNDPLAKVIRKRLKEENITFDLPVISSSESILTKGNVIASMMFVPSVAGLYLAYYVINDLIKIKE